jgi:two-component system nitrogen regulation sensor histidine kinase GlnL
VTITLATAFRPGIRLTLPNSSTRVSLPLEITITDNGPGVPEEIRSYLFDPFVTTKTKGTGLGLAMVAKIVGDHGGVIECETDQRQTAFRVLMPMHHEARRAEQEQQ